MLLDEREKFLEAGWCRRCSRVNTARMVGPNPTNTQGFGDDVKRCLVLRKDDGGIMQMKVEAIYYSWNQNIARSKRSADDIHSVFVNRIASFLGELRNRSAVAIPMIAILLTGHLLVYQIFATSFSRRYSLFEFSYLLRRLYQLPRGSCKWAFSSFEPVILA